MPSWTRPSWASSPPTFAQASAVTACADKLQTVTSKVLKTLNIGVDGKQVKHAAHLVIQRLLQVPCRWPSSLPTTACMATQVPCIVFVTNFVAQSPPNAASTYESASTSGFKHGRTETIRSATIERLALGLSLSHVLIQLHLQRCILPGILCVWGIAG